MEYLRQIRIRKMKEGSEKCTGNDWYDSPMNEFFHV